jgi:hypothetical protein
VEIDPLGRAYKRFAPKAARTVFASPLIADDQRVLQYLQMPEYRWQRNPQRLGKFYDRCIPSNKARYDGPALGMREGCKRAI